MSEQLADYRRLERRLWVARWRNDGRESAEEDQILDQLESAWMQLSDSEQALLRAEGPRCWPLDSSTAPPQFEDARYVFESEAWSYEGFSSPLQAILSSEAA
jgi:hypothetical protein